MEYKVFKVGLIVSDLLGLLAAEAGRIDRLNGYTLLVGAPQPRVCLSSSAAFLFSGASAAEKKTTTS